MYASSSRAEAMTADIKTLQCYLCSNIVTGEAPVKLFELENSLLTENATHVKHVLDNVHSASILHTANILCLLKK